MNAQPLEDLLAKLSSGDAAAAETVFRAYEPILRKVVRRQLAPPLRAKFDSIDVVQSIWADLLLGFRERGWQFHSAEHLRAFLIRATRNRFIDRCRRHKGDLDHELPLLDGDGDSFPASDQPDPSQLLEADELWDRLLALCPPEHHELLRLKRQGLSLNEIASRTGLHEDSVRRIVRTLARQLAVRQDP